jgi:hypothetical protein
VGVGPSLFIGRARAPTLFGPACKLSWRPNIHKKPDLADHPDLLARVTNFAERYGTSPKEKFGDMMARELAANNQEADDLLILLLARLPPESFEGRA